MLKDGLLSKAEEIYSKGYRTWRNPETKPWLPPEEAVDGSWVYRELELYLKADGSSHSALIVVPRKLADQDLTFQTPRINCSWSEEPLDTRSAIL